MYLKHIAILSVLALLAVAANAQEADSEYDQDVYAEEDAVHENVRRVDAPGLYPNAGDPNYKPKHTHASAPNPARFEGKDPPGVYEHGVGSGSGGYSGSGGGHATGGSGGSGVSGSGAIHAPGVAGAGRAGGKSGGGQIHNGQQGPNSVYQPKNPDRYRSRASSIDVSFGGLGSKTRGEPHAAAGTPAVVSAPRVASTPVHIGSGNPLSTVSLDIPGAL